MKKLVAVLLLIGCASVTVRAEEGMWLLSQLEQLNLHKKGMKLKIEDIYHPDKPSITDAIVWLGGCSSSFVSPDGLLLTNHHCAYGALQRASTQGTDYIKNGFLANSRAEEIKAIGMTASTLQEMRDVTDEVLSVVKGITDPVERNKRIDEKTTAMSEAIEAGREDIMAQIAEMYNGKQYVLFVYKRYEDVRIVYAPPASIGKYGGDIDNWMWPRHTGDFTFLRVYMAPDGSGAKYSPDNIPVKPKNYLRIATGDLDEGDFTFILGFPGFTTRWRTSNSVRWNLQYNYPETIQNFQEIIDIFDELTNDSPEGKIKVASFRASLANVMKNNQGKVDGMRKTHFLQKKIAFENELMAFINKDPKLKAQYGNILDNIAAEYEKLAATKTKDDILSLFGFQMGTLGSIANQIYGTVKEREKPESERNPGFSEKNVERTVARLHLRYYSFWPPVDKALLKRVLKKAAMLQGNDRIAGLEYIFTHNATSIDAFVEKAYAETRLTDAEYAKTLFNKSSEELRALNDPLINLAAAVYDDLDARQKRQRAFAATIVDLRKQYIDALYAWKGKGLYPDANSTMRFTYGYVRSYSPADAVLYQPFTTLTGVVEKDTGKAPFDMPAKLGELHRERDFGRWLDPDLNDVPVNFTHGCDITGGNSGSAVMNASGELIGLAFDGNYEAMTSDWQYDEDIQRTISVDIRYVLFLTEKVAGADYLLKEMGIQTSKQL